MSDAALVAPEPGQLVRVRDRFWVVGDVARSTQEADPLGDGGGQHLLNLISVEDDGLGEELEVVWEIEPGRRLIDEAALPDPARDGFDDPHRLEAFLDAVRWGAITSADSRALQAPFRSGIAIEDYQLDRSCGRCGCRGEPADRRRRRPRQDHRGGLVIQEPAAAAPHPHRARGLPRRRCRSSGETIPWNPNRLEQRIGRIDRHGQPSPEVLIHHFVGAGWQDAEPGSLEGDLQFLAVAAEKVNAIREDLTSVGPVIAEQVEEAMTGRRRRLDTGEAERRSPQRRVLKLERDLREEIGPLREALDATIDELGLTPQAVERVRLAMVEALRRRYHGWDDEARPELQRVARVVARP